MTNRLGFPCHNKPLPNPRLTPSISPSALLSHSPPPFLSLFAMSSSLQGATVAVIQCDPLWRFLSTSPFRLIVSPVCAVLASVSGCWYPRQQTWPLRTPTALHSPETTPSLKPQHPVFPFPSLPLLATCKPLIYSVCAYWDIRERLAILGMWNTASMPDRTHVISPHSPSPVEAFITGSGVLPRSSHRVYSSFCFVTKGYRSDYLVVKEEKPRVANASFFVMLKLPLNLSICKTI